MQKPSVKLVENPNGNCGDALSLYIWSSFVYLFIFCQNFIFVCLVCFSKFNLAVFVLPAWHRHLAYTCIYPLYLSGAPEHASQQPDSRHGQPVAQCWVSNHPRASPGAGGIAGFLRTFLFHQCAWRGLCHAHLHCRWDIFATGHPFYKFQLADFLCTFLLH